VLGFVLAGCGSSAPTGPSHSFTEVFLRCDPVGVNLQCTLTSEDIYSNSPGSDISSHAQWTVSNPAIASVSNSGFVTVLGHGELDITVSYPPYSSDILPSPVWSVLVDSHQAPQLLYFLSGTITESDGSTIITGATVEILDGYNAGASAVSNQYGYYQITRVLTNVTFTVQASKAGYLPSTTTYGVANPNGGTGGSPFLNFHLTRAAQ
jgi:hypothetical protein